MGKEIKTGICIRPSSVDSFLQCPQQWLRRYVYGEPSIPSARASIGTAIHSGVETMWTESMAAKEKIANMGAITDSAMESYKAEEEYGPQYDHGEDGNTARVEIMKGLDAFVEDVVPFTDMPDAVEKRFSIEIIGHPIVNEVGGTVDYIEGNVIADVKTSKRKPSVANYEIQQSIYRTLAKANGIPVDRNLIQGVILGKREVRGTILDMPINEEKSKYAVNTILDTLRLLEQDIVDPDILFRGNPKYYLCSGKYCNFYNDCKFVIGEGPKQAAPVKL